LSPRPTDGDPLQAGKAPVLREASASTPRWTWPYRLLLAAYWIALFLATHLPVPKIIEDEVSAFDKGIHGIAYFLLAALLILWDGWPYRLSLRRLTGFAAIVVAYAALDEWLQTLVGRMGDVWDWVYDSAGGICALLAAWALALAFPRTTAPADR
jgi:VanZ family protein